MHQFTSLLRLRLCGHQQREDAGPAPVACTHPCGYYDLVSLHRKQIKSLQTLRGGRVVAVISSSWWRKINTTARQASPTACIPEEDERTFTAQHYAKHFQAGRRVTAQLPPWAFQSKSLDENHWMRKPAPLSMSQNCATAKKHTTSQLLGKKRFETFSLCNKTQTASLIQ